LAISSAVNPVRDLAEFAGFDNISIAGIGVISNGLCASDFFDIGSSES